MTTQTYHLDFDGYWREPNISGLPDESGIYSVYSCTFDTHTKTVTINKLLYIGESEDVRERVKNHEKWPDWKKKLGLGEGLCFNAALISPAGARERSEAAMIFKHKPSCNTEYVDNFPFDTTTVYTKGKNNLLFSSFTVYRTQKNRLWA